MHQIIGDRLWEWIATVFLSRSVRSNIMQHDKRDRRGRYNRSYRVLGPSTATATVPDSGEGNLGKKGSLFSFFFPLVRGLGSRRGLT